MTRLLVSLSALALMAACGIDGPPQPPTAAPGVTLSGETTIGVKGEL